MIQEDLINHQLVHELVILKINPHKDVTLDPEEDQHKDDNINQQLVLDP